MFRYTQNYYHFTLTTFTEHFVHRIGINDDEKSTRYLGFKELIKCARAEIISKNYK